MWPFTLSLWEKFQYSFIAIPVKLFVKSKPIPEHPTKEFRVNTNDPVLYVLPYQSVVDIAVLHKLAKQFGLQDPLKGITIGGRTYPGFMFIDKEPGKLLSSPQKQKTINLLRQLLIEQRRYPQINIQMMPVSVFFNRKPGKEGKRKIPFHVLGRVSKAFHTLFSGHNWYTRFSRPVLLNNLIHSNIDEAQLAQKLTRVARIHFARQRLAAIGPKLPNYRVMLDQLLNSTSLSEAIQEEAKNKNLTTEKVRQNALSMLREISAKFTYWALRTTDFLLTWAWRHLYQGLKVHNVETIQHLAQKGHEIVYVPCHRSHMDYLLLSYVLYRQGLVPPHIAAGLNLNFWPAGPIFRRLGAFFIRRSFRGNKLYTAVFREYLSQLFIRGYSVEYFIEGGRSRTGRLLDPKTGMLMMTIQTLLRGVPRPITLVPVYIGYEHVLEVATYANELQGAVKQKENLWQTLKAFCKLKKLGYGFVNFGDPIPLNQFLTQTVPDWRNAIDPNEVQRPSWLTPTANRLAIDIMQNINRTAAVNAMNLCCTLLLSTRHLPVRRQDLLTQMEYLLTLLRRVPYDPLVTIPQNRASTLLEYALQMDMFKTYIKHKEKWITFNLQQRTLMTYYRNNIAHLVIILGLIARIILNHSGVTANMILKEIKTLYPYIQAELFLYQNNQQLTYYIEQLIKEILNLGLIHKTDNKFYPVATKKYFLEPLASTADDSLQRYAIMFSLLQRNPNQNRIDLERTSCIITENFAKSRHISSPEFWDKNIFAACANILREQGIFNSGDNPEKISRLCKLTLSLLTKESKTDMENALTFAHKVRDKDRLIHQAKQ